MIWAEESWLAGDERLEVEVTNDGHYTYLHARRYARSGGDELLEGELMLSVEQAEWLGILLLRMSGTARPIGDRPAARWGP